MASYFGYYEKLQHILVERVDQAMKGTWTGMQDLEHYREYAKEQGLYIITHNI